MARAISTCAGWHPRWYIPMVGQALVIDAMDGDNTVTIKNLGDGTMEVTLDGTDNRLSAGHV